MNADKFDWPLAGLPDPAIWLNINPFLNLYRFGDHTGVDWCMPGTDKDFGQPIYAAANGIVTFAGHYDGATSWGSIIILQHTLPDGKRVYTRSAHVISNQIEVRAGDAVTLGQIVGHVGNADGYYGMGGTHLHFDVSITDVLLKNPGHWPGSNRAGVIANYVDPISFILAHSGKVQNYRTTANLRVRQSGSLSARVLRTLPAGTLVTGAGDARQGGEYTWLPIVDNHSQSGWCAKQYLIAV